MHKAIGMSAAALALAGCEVSVKGDGAGGNTAGGEVQVKAPGFGLNVDLPAALKAELSGDTALLFPGASMSGVNVTAGAGEAGSVQLSFTTPAAVQEVLAWYRDPARAVTFGNLNVQQQGAGYRISGTATDGGGPFSLNLNPAPGGGTQGQISLTGS
jgi:hypothetical protein